MDMIGIDVGNSRIKAGYFRGKALKEVVVIPTAGVRKFSLPPAWEDIHPEYIGIASVVPGANRAIKEKIGKVFKGADVSFIKPSDCGIPLSIKNPGSVGVDRVLNCLAALKLFGPGMVVVDIGTAVTIDILTKSGKFAGGVIMPGPQLWLNSLLSAAMIKNGKRADAKIPGRDTGEAISAGAEYGLPGAINGILERIFKKYPSAGLVVTGGGSLKAAKHIVFQKHLRRHLTLEGIYHVFS